MQIAIQSKSIDIITIGQTFLSFQGEQCDAALKDMISFKPQIHGLAATVAIGCARLGLTSALVSQIGHDLPGEYVLKILDQENINTTQIHKTTQPTACALQSILSAPIAITHAALDVEQYPICQDFIAKSQFLLIHSADFSPALHQTCITAKKNLTKIILVLENETIEPLKPLLPLCHTIITTQTHTFSTLNELRSHTDAMIVIKKSNACAAFAHAIPAQWETAFHTLTAENNDTFDNLSGFIAGFLQSWIQTHSVDEACQTGLHCQALANSRQGNAKSLPSKAELSCYTDNPSVFASPFLDHLHYASTRHDHYPALTVFNLGSPSQWDKLTKSFEADATRIEQAQHLISQTIAQLNTVTTPVGITMDAAMHTVEGWLARAIEIPAEPALPIHMHTDFTQTLLAWPKKQVVKLSMTYHPDDKFTLRGQQEAMLRLWYNACRATSHELLIELAPASNNIMTASTFSHIMQRFYSIGIYPDWWQIATPRDQRSWDNIHRTIEENDAYCRGILVSAPLSTFEQLSAMLPGLSKQPKVKGIVAGKGLIQANLEAWLSQQMTDDIFIEEVKASFQKVIALWSAAQYDAHIPHAEKVLHLHA